MNSNDLFVQEIWQVNERSLGIKWGNGQESQYDAVQLRKLCPCAACVDEMTGKRKEFAVSDDVRPKQIRSVGQYALAIDFDDGHNTGIYTFRNLYHMQG